MLISADNILYFEGLSVPWLLRTLWGDGGIGRRTRLRIVLVIVAYIMGLGQKPSPFLQFN
mgnify:CR=1 FL=1